MNSKENVGDMSFTFKMANEDSRIMFCVIVIFRALVPDWSKIQLFYHWL